MKPLDLYTLLYVVGAISLLFALLMLLFYRLTPAIKGPLHWALGSFSTVVGSMLFVIYPVVSGYLAFVVGGIITVLAILYYYSGICLFIGNSINYRYFYGLIISEFILAHFFYFIVPSPRLRMISFSFVCFISTLLVVVELLKHTNARYRVAFVLCSIVFSVSAATSLSRVIAIIILKPEEANVPIFANILFYFMANVTQALLMFSFLLLISVKIAEQLEQKVQDQRKFYSIIAHDLSGPVGMINVMLNMINHDNEIGKKEKKQVTLEAEKLSTSTYNLLQNLLVWSKNQLEDLRPKAQSFDLNKVIQDNIEFMQQIALSKGISVIYQPNHAVFCFGDSRMIDTVIRNLISNAMKFTKPEGYIEVSCSDGEKNVQFSVADSGVGMTEETQKKIFSSCEKKSTIGTLGEKGSGLGLKICKDFVELNNGTIQVKSIPNQGTKVVVNLPVG